jgi:hypothetical protein
MKWNNWVRQLHRWVCIAFVLGVAAYMVAMRGGGQPPAWMGLLALVPLILLLVSGALSVRIALHREMAAARGMSAKEPVLLSGGNPQIAKGDGDAPVQAYIAAMPGWKREAGARLDALIVRTVPEVRKAVKWNSPFYGVEGAGLVPVVPLLHALHQGGVLPRIGAGTAAAGYLEGRQGALFSTSMRTKRWTRRRWRTGSARRWRSPAGWPEGETDE